MVTQEITIIGTYKDELKDNTESIIRTKEETIKRLNVCYVIISVIHW